MKETKIWDLEVLPSDWVLMNERYQCIQPRQMYRIGDSKVIPDGRGHKLTRDFSSPLSICLACYREPQTGSRTRLIVMTRRAGTVTERITHPRQLDPKLHAWCSRKCLFEGSGGRSLQKSLA